MWEPYSKSWIENTLFDAMHKVVILLNCILSFDILNQANLWLNAKSYNTILNGIYPEVHFGIFIKKLPTFFTAINDY